ncbi:MAG: DUF2953 domain-containing protein [Oscillospiraceae bacterium]|nr:DUF2953 domain-containing protein [Oscillospiraceae bacterium]
MVVLYILLGIIAAIVLLFCVKITVELQYSETFTLDLKVLFIKLRLLPAKPKKKKPPKAPQEETPPEDAQEKPSEGKPKGENFVMRFYHEQGFDGVVRFLKEILAATNTMLGDIFKRSFVVEKLFLDMCVAKKDAAQTAIAYGKTCAAVFPTMGYLCNTLRVRKYNVNIYPDYLATGSCASILLRISVRPIKLTNALVRFAFRALVSFLRAKKYASDKKKQQPVATERNVEK